jgi:hypothetical protein
MISSSKGRTLEQLLTQKCISSSTGILFFSFFFFCVWGKGVGGGGGGGGFSIVTEESKGFEDKYAKCGSIIDSYKVFQLLHTFSLQFSIILFSSNFCKSCWFECALWVKSLSYLEHSPSSTNSMSCSIKALICHLCCLFAIPAMTKKPSIFSLLPIILQENKTKPGTNIIISWPKPALGPVQTWETDSAVSSI